VAPRTGLTEVGQRGLVGMALQRAMQTLGEIHDAFAGLWKMRRG
jgi:hypothetical protein